MADKNADIAGWAAIAATGKQDRDPTRHTSKDSAHKVFVWLTSGVLLAGCAPIMQDAQGLGRLPLAQACTGWLSQRGERGGADLGKAHIMSSELACFDGKIGQADEDEGTRTLLHWARQMPAKRQKTLVIHSHGGDANAAMDILESLQAHSARVIAIDICASSCANYIYAGLRDRHVADGTLILFHGGFSDPTRKRISGMIDELYAKSGDKIADQDADRARLLAKFDTDRERQDRLLSAAGVDAFIVHGVDAADFSQFAPSYCGGDSKLPRNFVYFERADAERLGIAPRTGKVQTEGDKVNGAIADRTDDNASFVACRMRVDP